MEFDGDDGVRLAERSLVIRAQGGDRRAFGDLITRHMRRAYFAALALVGSHDDALDLSQDAFVRAFRALQTIDPERPFYPWLYQIVRRLSFNFLRDGKARRATLERATPWLVLEAGGRAAQSDPQRRLERTEIQTQVQAAIEQLALHEREVLVLKEFEGLKYREIADLLNIPIGTVMSRLYAARRSLAASLEAQR